MDDFSYGPLIKSSSPPHSEPTQEKPSEGETNESDEP